MMKVKIPYELKLKFLNMEGLSAEKDIVDIVANKSSLPIRVSGPTYYDLKLDLNNEPELLKICIDWYDIIDKYFRTSYKAYRINIGPYEGLWPVKIEPSGVVHFHVDNADVEKKNWKDWFVKEDVEYALNSLSKD